MPLFTIASKAPSGAGLTHLVFDRPAGGHEQPGQVVTARLGEHKPGYFALANRPGEPVELLVKGGAPLADALIELEPGASVELSDAIGRGFQLPAGDRNPLVLFVVGSGLSAVRALVEAELSAALPRPVTLLYGTFTLAHRAFANELDRWAAGGVEVVPVLGQPEPGWAGASGFVQHVAQDRGLIRPGVTAVAVGFPAMIDEIRRLFASSGASPDAVHTNF